MYFILGLYNTYLLRPGKWQKFGNKKSYFPLNSVNAYFMAFQYQNHTKRVCGTIGIFVSGGSRVV